MNLSRYLTIRHQFWLLMAFVSTGIAVIILMNANVHRTNNLHLVSLDQQYYPAMEVVVRLDGTLPRLTQQFETAVVTGEEDALSEAALLYQLLNKDLAEIKKLLPQKSNELAHVETLMARYFGAGNQLALDFINMNESVAVISRKAEQNRQTQESLEKELKTLQDYVREQVVSLIGNARESAEQAGVNSVISGLIVVAFLLSFGFAILRSISQSIAIVTARMNEIANGEGDLTVRIHYDGKDEVAELVNNVNQFISKLHATISDTISSIHQLEAITGQLSDSRQDTSRFTAEQQSNIQQVTLSVGEMLQTVSHVADYASQASEQANDANTKAEDGFTVVQQTVNVINVLSDDVRKIATVIDKLEQDTTNVDAILSTIKGIADQTNLLALNAAIEAARAGEQGRGFAVVADEVRTLAARTQQSTEEIQVVLGELQVASKSAVEAMHQGLRQTEDGVSSAATAGESLRSITEKVAGITVVNDQIASATEEQHQTSLIIQEQLQEFNRSAEQVSSSSDRLGIASDQLVGVVEQLSHSTAQFKV
ncbi:methyl-accepting chemotaxis protein [Photobacterium sanguinicancri]|uniref:Methyl-accepting chemotaxis protein n=1 Tax=Photobacterium sanguinicancri TaxID=875932 RepID=A0AAW7Y7N8_9GAMM|nr:methyl-accepting chemotaxis protein [Photobacterium sanguinicancri]MDO6544527.1 methyl-accepting chemotaxis protein [Photobacterium sanguinicancri]